MFSPSFTGTSIMFIVCFYLFVYCSFLVIRPLLLCSLGGGQPFRARRLYFGCKSSDNFMTSKILSIFFCSFAGKSRSVSPQSKPAYPSRHCAPALSRCLSVVADARVCCYPAALEECRRSYPGGQPIEGCLVHRFSAPGPHSLCGAGYHVSIILSGEYCITDMSVWNEVPRALLRPLSP